MIIIKIHLTKLDSMANPTFWSTISLKKKLDLWSIQQINQFFLPLVELKQKEIIYDIGSGFSPLGLAFHQFIQPEGSITGFDIDKKTVKLANEYVENQNISKIHFQEANVYDLGEMQLEGADLVMCQQLLVNVSDHVTALENMLDVTKSSGRILCVENINYGAYIHRPDFSWKTNLRLSQIWQQLCIAGKFGKDRGLTTVGSQLPQTFHELGLHNVQYQIISPSTFPQPPYSEDYIRNFVKNYKEEKFRIKDLILNHWAEGTDLAKDEIDFFIDFIDSEYDLYAIKNNLFLTQWYYPLIVIVGWLEERKINKENKNQEQFLDIDINGV